MWILQAALEILKRQPSYTAVHSPLPLLHQTLGSGAIDITWFTQVAEEDALKAVVQRVIHITSFNAIAHWTALCDEEGRVLPGMTRQRLQWRRGGPVEIAPDAGAEYAPDSYAQPNAGGQNRVLLVRVLFQMNADLDASGMITDEHTADSTINYVKRGILTAVCSLARRQVSVAASCLPCSMSRGWRCVNAHFDLR